MKLLIVGLAAIGLFGQAPQVPLRVEVSQGAALSRRRK
jgi:hypothetical protein